jgi:hypothetical protein
MDRYGMRAVDGKLGIAIFEESQAKGSRVSVEIGSAKRLLDCDFPQARGTEHELVRLLFDHVTGRTRQSARAERRPKQQVRVEQQPQRLPPNIWSISSAPRRSKSSGTLIWPAMKPMRFSFFAGPSR